MKGGYTMDFYINLTNNLKLQIDSDTVITGYVVKGNIKDTHLEKVFSTSFEDWNKTQHEESSSQEMFDYLACILTHIDWFSIGRADNHPQIYSTNSVQSIIKF
ncbi:hypothetical protein FD50_GL001541 [Liquorilactobacillus satsumensis DSM 16230 = JCM 12392]|uniref:Uncharacterized protein n=1 Tax=Liquorilactobacillus satsumensis DSM 16230 = JCM 12392 TaxID=1423801 RepID=A0A0R1V2A3_9LACO|nr:hypothetical protein FD50_GL001541 [Liquorilactobacillus satsumensis DSM 16230 = JCM 12392]